MSTPMKPRRELPGTYFVQDRFNEQELARLQLQDRMITTGMGGVLPEQPDPTVFQRVLDVGCGTGDWLIELAKKYPDIQALMGVDVNKRMVKYARAQAEAEGVSDRVEFHVMDALSMLDFPSEYFNLVNQRFGQSWLRTWDWPKLLLEFQRVTRPGGIIRITEGGRDTESNSPALTCLMELVPRAFYQSGHAFALSSDEETSQLTRLLLRYGVQNIQTRAYNIEYRSGTAEGEQYYENTKRAFRTMVPFFNKWLRVPDNYETLYQQALKEMQQPDFMATWNLLTAWGEVNR